MDLGLGFKPDERPNKFRAVPNKEHADTVKIMAITAKLCLSSALQVRAIKSILIRVWMVPSDHPLVTEAMANTRKFAELSKQLTQDSKTSDQRIDFIGLPHEHVWNALITVLLADLEKKKEDLAVKEKIVFIQEYCANMTQAGHRALLREVAYARVQKCYEREFRKLELNVAEGTPSHQVFSYLVDFLERTPNVVEKPGQAPPGDLERRLQQ